jgi:hypothetical protein
MVGVAHDSPIAVAAGSIGHWSRYLQVNLMPNVTNCIVAENWTI